MGNNDAPLGDEPFDVPVAERQAVVAPDTLADDPGGIECDQNLSVKGGVGSHRATGDTAAVPPTA